MTAVIIITVIVVLIFDALLASMASDVANDKGYDKSTWFHMCFWLGPISYIIVAAMPDRVMREKVDVTNKLLEEMINVKNASPVARSEDQQAKAARYAAALETEGTKVGSIVTYGHYEQDNNANNGKKAIEWVVLKYDNTTGQALLLSRYGLDAHRFDASKYQGWDKSEIRTWLNSTFLNAAFTI